MCTTMLFEFGSVLKSPEMKSRQTKICDTQPALNMFRTFVDRFVNNEIKTLKHDDTK